MIIAVDGPAASGKGTLARRLARHFGYAYLDTGKLYRAVGLAVLRAGGDPEDVPAAVAAAKNLKPEALDDPDLPGDAAAGAASKVAAIAGVRAALLAFQQDFAAYPPNGAAGAILDGRDIGTVVCPGAHAKLFVTATPEVRAERRFRELSGRGLETSYERVLRDIRERDARDSGRDTAPMVAAADAVALDTSNLGIEEAFQAALAIVSARLGA